MNLNLDIIVGARKQRYFESKKNEKTNFVNDDTHAIDLYLWFTNIPIMSRLSEYNICFGVMKLNIQ